VTRPLTLFTGLRIKKIAADSTTFVDGHDPEPTALDYPGIDDGIRGMAFIEATVESSNHNARWTPLKI
jgi:hypothetical protein